MVCFSFKLDGLDLGLSFNDLGILVSDLDLETIGSRVEPAGRFDCHLECVSLHLSKQVLRVDVSLVFLVGGAEHHIQGQVAVCTCAQVYILDSEGCPLDCDFGANDRVENLSTVVH